MILNIKGDINNMIEDMTKFISEPSNERIAWLLIFFGGILLFIIVYSLLNKKK